jgi:tetratricopeptide (TPR) repeat protein
VDSRVQQNTMSGIGVRIKRARKERGLTQDQLATPQFTKGYISALERGAVRPSLKALEFIASRLELPLSHFVARLDRAGEHEETSELEALQEDLNYQYNYARMLIRSDNVEEAFDLIQTAEESASYYKKMLPSHLLYRPSFLRGLGHLQMSDPQSARPELESALEAAGEDACAQVIVRNMLGVAYYLLNQPAEAVQQHLRCIQAVEKGTVKDLSLRLSILRNLANDYWALHDVPQAIGTYKKALPLVEDLDGPGRQAEIFWALAMAYRASNDWTQAKLYATRALHIFESLDDLAGAASMCVHLAELLMRESRYDEASELLAQAKQILVGTDDQVLLSSVHCAYADLYRRQGNLEDAFEHAERALTLVNEVFGEPDEGLARENTASGSIETATNKNNAGGGRKARRPVRHPELNVVRAYVEALHQAALVEEGRGNPGRVDTLFGRAQNLIKDIGLTELAYTTFFSYGDILKARGEFEQAAEQYRLAAQSGVGHVRPRV